MGKNRRSKNIKCITITGPSASGKSMLAERLSKALGKTRCVVISQDDYYKDWSHLPKKARKKLNFDNAKAFDFNLLKQLVEKQNFQFALESIQELPTLKKSVERHVGIEQRTVGKWVGTFFERLEEKD